jgi:hypothetical protein
LKINEFVYYIFAAPRSLSEAELQPGCADVSNTTWSYHQSRSNKVRAVMICDFLGVAGRILSMISPILRSHPSHQTIAFLWH